MSGTCRDAWLDSGWLQFIQSSHFNCNKLITLFHLALTKGKETGSWMWLRPPGTHRSLFPVLGRRQPRDWTGALLPRLRGQRGLQRRGSQWPGSWGASHLEACPAVVSVRHGGGFHSRQGSIQWKAWPWRDQTILQKGLFWSSPP